MSMDSNMSTARRGQRLRMNSNESALDAQYAARLFRVADVRPKLPNLTGSWATSLAAWACCCVHCGLSSMPAT
eukprot:4923547-Karenia_brevis.AAC.1